MRAFAKKAQEVYTKSPRKDINPKQVPVDNKLDTRFKDRDLMDNQVDHQPMDGKHFDYTVGRDPSLSEEDDIAPVR